MRPASTVDAVIAGSTCDEAIQGRQDFARRPWIATPQAFLAMKVLRTDGVLERQPVMAA